MFYCRLILLVTLPFTIATEYTITSSEALAVQTNLGYQLALLDDASTTGNWTGAKKIFLQKNSQLLMLEAKKDLKVKLLNQEKDCEVAQYNTHFVCHFQI